jgi:hypothetical protein
MIATVLKSSKVRSRGGPRATGVQYAPGEPHPSSIPPLALPPCPCLVFEKDGTFAFPASGNGFFCVQNGFFWTVERHLIGRETGGPVAHNSLFDNSLGALARTS